MPHRIYNWLDISHNYSDSIILGNGASISIDQSFSYGSLKEHATVQGLLNDNVQRLFDFFGTHDFELILRLVWQANNVNGALLINDQQTRLAYEHVRDCLIKAVQSIHPEHSDVEAQFPKIAKFLRQFHTVLSLNYDLTLYWVIMYYNRIEYRYAFKDCIIHGEFDSNWARLRESYGRRPTLVFYPHGNLVMARNKTEQETKLETRDGHDLLRSILVSWQEGNVVPLFVSEGTSIQKMNAIQNSHYLNTVYREVLPNVGNDLTIYGWGVGEHDIHILKRLEQSEVSRIAVSVLDNDQGYCNRVQQMIHDNVRRNVEVVFFNAKSPGCWNQ
jgi:hypothetical protein